MLALQHKVKHAEVVAAGAGVLLLAGVEHVPHRDAQRIDIGCLAVSCKPSSAVDHLRGHVVDGSFHRHPHGISVDTVFRGDFGASGGVRDRSSKLLQVGSTNHSDLDAGALSRHFGRTILASQHGYSGGLITRIAAQAAPMSCNVGTDEAVAHDLCTRKRPRLAEVCKLDVAVRINEKVGRFNVAMQERRAEAVQIRHSSRGIEHVGDIE